MGETYKNRVSMKRSEYDVAAYFRAQHHAIAQLIAMGMSSTMITRRTGVSRHRQTLLGNDPAFRELVASYEGKRDDDFDENRDPYRELSYANMMAGEMTVAEHFERAADNGELVPIVVANRISQERADRLGYSKHSVIHHDHDFAGALDRAIARSNSVLIEGQAIEEQPSPVVSSPAPPEVVPQIPSPDPKSAPPRPLSIAEVRRREVLNRRFG